MEEIGDNVRVVLERWEIESFRISSSYRPIRSLTITVCRNHAAASSLVDSIPEQELHTISTTLLENFPTF